ncbi:MAG: hypothetical protein N3G21_05130 [Candidatus Hydrogenedentes bacterium]|nr:hypothetical protein [Candidatus Hydrogenedentota bacterium]
MARVALLVDDIRARITLKAILESKGNIIDIEKYEVVITDKYDIARKICRDYPVIVIASVSKIPIAVELMKIGVFGYIFVPFQPEEANLMIERAVAYWKCVAGEKSDMSMKTLREVEMEYIRKVYAECGFCKKETAKRLGIGRNTLWRKLKELKLEQNT